ncbi:Ribonuclease Oy [Oopsacas minuta]|uniref:Ribonuclease Oy n=1 Tax=Oopsacas minuta TaxID=111878 RepID=A0AAV7KLT5_9METZ|nr:Ribonuclease Oy [Oopsacas minuta]
MEKLWICLFAIFLFIVANAALRELQLEPEDTKFDHLTFTQFWAPEACRSIDPRCKFTNVSSDWTIHGLWPTMGNTHGPAHCTNESFNQSLLTADMLKFMDKYWITYVKYEPNPSFWEHEWIKHGTCAVDGDKTEFLNQKSYFQTTINLYNKYNISTILTKANIKPGMSRPLDDFLNAFKTSEIGKTVRLDCNGVFLLDVEICFNLSLQPIDCTSPTGCSSKKNVSYEPY